MFHTPWCSLQTVHSTVLCCAYFGNVRLRSSLTNCGLPVLTGRLGSLTPAALWSVVCLFPPRRFRTVNNKRDAWRIRHRVIKNMNKTQWGLLEKDLLTDGPWVTWQFGQWYKSISVALSSSTPTQLHRNIHTQHTDDVAELKGLTANTYTCNFAFTMC